MRVVVRSKTWLVLHLGSCGTGAEEPTNIAGERRSSVLHAHLERERTVKINRLDLEGAECCNRLLQELRQEWSRHNLFCLWEGGMS